MNENENWGMQGAVVGLGARAAEVRQRILLPESEHSSYLGRQQRLQAAGLGLGLMGLSEACARKASG